MRAQANATRQIPRHTPINATTLAPHAPAPPPERQATLPLTPTSSPAGHSRENDDSGSSLTPTPGASPAVTKPKLVLKHHPGGIPAVTGPEEEASIASRPVGEQFLAQSRVINDPASAPSRSSSVSLESLLAVHEGVLEGQHEVDAVGVEELKLRVSPWVDSPSPIALRPAEKRKSAHLKECDNEKRATTGSNGRPKKRQRVEMEQVANNGLPEDQTKVPTGSTPAVTDRPSSHPLAQPNMKRPYNGARLKQPPLHRC